MKKNLLLLVAFVATSFAFAQVNVTSSGGTPTATYTTLATALAAVDSGLHTGVISVGISANTTETVSAVLIASGSGSASYASISISPTGGASRTITGAITGHLIDLNGARNVTINGLNSAGNALTISNTATGASSCIRFIADACLNTVTNCTITGSTTSFGNIFFSTGSISGNDSNIISNNNIGVAGSNFPLNGIYSLGTSVTIENNANTISGNNIFDYYNATVVTNGINVNSGNSNWTISNNKLYQTANRLYTTGNTHSGISVLSGAGYTINGNVIGYANASGTGTTNMVGSSLAPAGFPGSYTVSGTANATRYIAINCAFLAAGAVSSIQGNTIAGFSLYTSSGATTANGILCGIAVTSGNANIGTITGNTIGSTTGTGSIYTVCTTTAGTVVGIYATSANTVVIQNNSVGAIDAMGSTASICGAVTGINTAGAGTFTIVGNTIGNTTNPNLRMGNLLTGTNLSNVGTTFSAPTGTAVFRGIFNAASGIVTIGSALLPNIVQNASINSTGTGVAFRGIETSSGTYLIANDTIRNITSASTNATVATALLAGVGILSQGGTLGSIVTKNIIYNLFLTNTTTSGTNVAGVSVSNTSIDITSNTIYNITNASTSVTLTTPGTASGIMLRSGTSGGNVNIINNMISLGNGQTTNTCFIGIWGNHGSSPNPNVNIYNNTINIEGTVTSGATSSFGFHRGNFATTAVNQVVMNVKNNIFNNTRSGGTGGHYAIGNYFNATTTSAVGWAAGASNNNVLNANSATIGFWTSAQTLAGWRTISAGDANSFSGITTTFVNTVLGDLHLNMGTTPTQLESNGVTITGINTDIDNQNRPGPTGSVNGGAIAPDLGADEFDGVYSDLSPPILSFTAYSNAPVVINRTVTATISDGSGVRIATNGPQLYYKKTTDNNAFNGNTSADNGWKYVSATNVGSLFTFNINYSILNGGSVSAGDTIQYFIVAMDSSVNSNIAISNGTLALIPTTTTLGAANFPITGLTSSYRIVGNLSGTVTVGVGGTYSSFTNAGGLFDDMNNKFVNGNIIAQVISDISTETGAVGLLEFNSGNQLTIVPDAPILRTISTTSTILLGLLGADNVTIDGRSGGSGKYLLFQNNNTSTTSITLLISNVTNTSNGCQNINIKNTLFECGSTNLTGGTLVNNVHIQNNGHRKIFVDSCEFKKAYNGVVVGAGTVTNNYDSLFFTNNIFGEDLASKYLTFTGIQLFYTSSSFVKNNVFKNITTNLALNNSSVLVNTGSSNVVIEQNRIFGSRSTNAGLYGTYGISVLAGTNIIIKNNAIYNINSASYNLTTLTDNTYGIRLASASGVKIYNNSISIDSASLNTTSAQYTACIANFGATGVEIVNNILRNTQTGFTGSKAYALYLSSGTVSAANNNVLFTSGANAVLSLVGTIDYTTLPALQTATSAHANSYIFNPSFTDTTSNLTPASCVVNNSGVVLADVTNDLNGVSRSSTPDIGAVEFIPTPIAAPTATSPINYCKNSTATNLSATGVNTLIWYNNVAGGVGSLTAPTPVTTTVGVTNFYVADSNQILGCVSPRTQILVNISDSVYSNTISSLPQTICSGSTPASLTASTPTGGDGTTYTYSWLSSTTSATAGFAAASGTNNTQNYTPGALTANIWYRRRVASGACASDTTAAVAITVNPVIAGNTISSNQSILSGATPTGLTGALPTGGNSSYTYTWLVSTTSATTGFSAIGSSNTQNYSPGALTVNTWYRRLVVSGSCSDTSSAAAISIISAIANNTISGASTICSGSTPTGLTGTLPTGATGTYTYTWLSSTTSATAGFSAIASSNTQNYSPGALTVSTWYRRYVVSGAASDTSVAVKVTVNAAVATNTISSSPQTICSGSTPASLTASTPTGGDGTTYTYSWLSSTTSATTGFVAASGTNNTQNYTPGALTANTWYRRTVTSGVCSADTTAAIAITVNPVIAGNTIGSNQSIVSGATPAGLTGALPTGGNSTYTYTWLVSTASATTGFSAIGSSNTQNYSPGALTVNTWYRRLVVSGLCSDTSSAVAISITSAIANNTISGASTICSGSTPTGLTGTLPTGATGTYTYTWLSSTTSATAGFSAIASSNTQNYSPGSLTQTTWYRRYVVSGAASDTSTAITVTVNTPGIWGGTVSAAWNNTANWTCPQIPTSATNVTIASGATNMPTITDVQQCNNLTINSGATLTLTGASAQLNLYGAFTNNGTFTNTSTGKTVFSGSAQQTVPAGNYTKLQVNNAAGVVLGGAVTLSDSLLLTNGTLTLGANNLTLGTSSYASAGSASSYIKTNGAGAVIVNGVGSTGKTGNVIIPVGNTTYNPAILLNTGITDNYTVRLFDSVTTNYTGSAATGAKLTSNALNRTWIINEGTAGGSNATVTLQWNTADELSGFTRALSYVARYNGTVWMSTTATAATGSNPYTQTRSGITSFSPFSVGSGGTLPVELIVFAGTRKSEKAYLRWTTASEINNDYFIVERSLDNRVFEAIGPKIKGQGNSNSVNRYESVDADAMSYALANNSSTVYYRLRQVDFDGTVNYSKSISVLFDDEFIVFNATISPNPFDGSVQLNILTNNEAPAQIEIIDIKGLVVYSEKLNFLQGNSNYVLHKLDHLAEGMYFIKVKQGIDVKVIKATRVNSIR